jgi:hypothetical protein
MCVSVRLRLEVGLYVRDVVIDVVTHIVAHTDVDSLAVCVFVCDGMSFVVAVQLCDLPVPSVVDVFFEHLKQPNKM